MMKATLNFNDGTGQAVLDEGWDGIRRAVEYYWDRLQEALNVQNTGTRKRRKRDTTSRGGGPKGSTYTVYDHPSRPGEPPHKVTGAGRAGTLKELDQAAMTGRVGITANVKYMAILALHRDREFMLRTLKKFWLQIAKQAAGGP